MRLSWNETEGKKMNINRFSCLWFLAIAAEFAIVAPVSAQQAAPPLAEIKAAAEKGNAQAQDKLGDAFRLDTANALIWYRKAAEQGVAHSQSELGRILMGYAKSPAAKPEARTQHADEAIQWYLKAANQGDKSAQLGFGRQFEEGKFIKQDYAEAYKWFALASERGSPFDSTALGAKWARDDIILKMSQDQITEGRKRVSAFVPHQATKDELPEPSWVKQIKLQGISGPDERRLAIINGQTFQKGDESKVKVGNKSVKIRCLEVRESSALVAIEGIEGERELKFTRD
jgi:TPR repeat protein